MAGWSRKRGSMRYYSLMAKTYDTLYSEEQKTKIEAMLERVKLVGNCRLLDCGCGTGLLFEYVASEADMVVGFDVSRGILEEAKKRGRNFRNVHLVLADADYMPFKDEVFNHIFAVTLLQNMPKPLDTLAEAKRVAKKGAFVAVTGLKKKFTRGFLEGLSRKLGLSLIEIRDGNEQLKCYIAIFLKS